MRSFVEQFMVKYDYPEEARSVLLSAYDALMACDKSRPELVRMIKEYDVSYGTDLVAEEEKMKEISLLAGVNEYTGMVIRFICYMKRLKEYYDEAGYGEAMYMGVANDIKYKLWECKLVKGVWGSFVTPWFCRFFRLDRFCFERLQFELIDFNGDYVTDGVALKPDTKVINVHIPRTGGRLDKESVDRSYAMAADFFKKKFGLDRIIFHCNSWLLFPKNKELLKEGSNLLSFISDYRVVEVKEYDNYSEVWRLFDTEYTEDHSKLPADSSLRRAYIDLMNKGEPIGSAKCVYIYED